MQMGHAVGGALAATLAPLTALKHLNISRRCLGDEGAAELVALTSLEHLDSWNNRLSGAWVAALATLSALTHLDLMGNHIVCAGVATLMALTALNPLVLPMSCLGGARALACLPSLASLYACGCFLGDLSDQGIRALAALTQLRALTLWGSDTESCYAELHSREDAAQRAADAVSALAMLPAVLDLLQEENIFWPGISSE